MLMVTLICTGREMNKSNMLSFILFSTPMKYTSDIKQLLRGMTVSIHFKYTAVIIM